MLNEKVLAEVLQIISNKGSLQMPTANGNACDVVS